MREAVRNNVLATDTVARACRERGVGTFVLISTDKAVDPVNVLGATKRLAEMACQSLADRRSTRFVTVRFGNVLDSAGSVVPLFREQIRKGGPVTVTDPEVTRFFMTIPEACQLILQASAIGSHEAVYTLDMGEPVAIRVLAEQMIRLAGKQPGRDIAIVYTGPAPGRETARNALPRRRALSPDLAPEDPAGRAARRSRAEPMHRRVAQLREACARYDLDALAEAAARGGARVRACTRRARARPPPWWPFPPATPAGSDDPRPTTRRIRKAVFPVAGLGTRFLPATKTVPKEMLPIIDKPLIQYAVDEAIEAGCDTLVFVTNRYKHAVADYFDKAYELEQKLERAGKHEQLELVRNVLPPRRARGVRDPGRSAGPGPCGVVREGGDRR